MSINPFDGGGDH